MQFERAIEVHRPMDEAFRYVADLRNAARWDPDVVGVELTSLAPLEVGARYRVIRRVGPVRLGLGYEVEEIDPPRRIRWRARGRGSQLVDQLFFEPLPAGTAVRRVAEVEVAERLAPLEGTTARALERSVDRAMAGLRGALDGHGDAGRRTGLLTALTDRLVLPGMASFTRWGYAVRRLERRPVRVDLRGRTMVVTGATAGLGLATAGALAGLGARVILVGRDRGKLDRARREIEAATGDANLATERVDLARMREVRGLAGRLRAVEPRLDVLVNNAGVLCDERSVTDEGIERTLATNLLGHFVLTNELLPLLERTAPARIINVSSGGMYTQRLAVDDLQSERGRYDGVRAYARSKRGQVILTELWAERLQGTGVVVNAMHPGWADTPGVRSSLPGFRRAVRPLLRSPAEGADTIVWLAASPAAERETGKFWLDREPRATHLLPGTKEAPAERRQLWQALEELAEGAKAFSRSP